MKMKLQYHQLCESESNTTTKHGGSEGVKLDITLKNGSGEGVKLDH